jgi:glycosyltransferase involved in cell wall biosynthesis
VTSLSAIIPTAATDLPRLTLLRRSIESALGQAQSGDEVIVAADTTSDPLEAARELCGRLGQEAPEGVAVRFVPFAGERHDWGHSQLNNAQLQARGDYITYSDDDDIWLPGAFGAIRDAADSTPHRAPMLFRFMTHYGIVCWQVKGLVRQATIGGHCLVVPSLPSLLGTWGPHYEGDFTMIRDTLDLWAAVGVEPLWVDRLIAQARPVVRYQ